MRMLVLGAGQQGSACAYDLLAHSDHEVVIADLHVDSLPEFLRPFLGGRLRAVKVDANDRGAMRPVLEAGSHFCDLGGNTEIVMQQKELHARARERGVSVIPDCGLAPGMVNILAEHGIRLLDRPRSVRILR